MATLTIPVALRGGGADVVIDVPFGVNTWTQIALRFNSTEWNTINGLIIGYAAKVTIDGGVSYTDWGGLEAVSPTFMKDRVTKIEPGGIWNWNPAFAGGGTLRVTVHCPTAFNWGAIATMT